MSSLKKQYNTRKKGVAEKPQGSCILQSKWFPYFIVTSIIVLVYARTIWFDYTYSDDDQLILKHFDEISNLSALKGAFLNTFFNKYFVAGFYRPLLVVSFILDAQISQTNLWMFHVTNILYHILACCMLIGLMRQMRIPKNNILIGALIFSVHPLASQAVSWIPGRNDTLVALFIIISLRFLVAYLEEQKHIYLTAHLFVFFCALLTKETAAIMPVIGAFYLYGIHRKSFKSKQSYFLLAGWIVCLFVWMLLRSKMLAGQNTNGIEYSFHAFIYNMRMLPEIAGKIVVPLTLSPYTTYSAFSTYLGTLVIIIAVLYFVMRRDEWVREKTFAAFWIVIFLIPGLVLLLSDSVYKYDYLEHRAYLSLAGFAIFVALISRDFNINKKSWKQLFVVVLFSLSLMSYYYSGFFANGSTYWERAVEKSPNAAYAYFGLANIPETNETDINQTEKCYRKALQLYPGNAIFHNNLGTLLLRQNRLASAEIELLKANTLDSLNPLYLNNLGVVYGKQKNFDKAVEIYSKAHKLKPYDHVPLINLGYCAYLKGEDRLAEDYYKQALAVNPKAGDACLKLSVLYDKELRFKESLYFVNKASENGITINPRIITELENRINHR